MPTTPIQLLQVDEILSQQFSNTVKLPKVAAPFTTVVNRAMVTDFSKDLMPRMGIERIIITAPPLQEIQGEVGLIGSRVFKFANDIHDQVRFVGAWSGNTIIGVGGAYVQATGNLTDFLEITFYGTGLNLLTILNSSYDARTSVDGGAEGANVLSVTTSAQPIFPRGYAINQIVNITSGLSLGLHTVKLRNNSAGNGMVVYGFEILNTAGTSPNTLQLMPGTSYIGGKKLNKTTLSVDSYNTNFESGTLGTRGGHVVLYHKANGMIGKAIQPTDASQLNLTSASHTNEDLIRSYSPREFGAGRTDDFTHNTTGTLTDAADRSFTLDDGTTALAARLGLVATDGLVDQGVMTYDVSNTISTWITFSFVGTGLDVEVVTSNATKQFNEVYVNGVNVGSLASQSTIKILKIVSGLPYGTHTVRLLKTASSLTSPAISKFLVYGPRKPTVPSDAVEVADYYLMANYSFAGATADSSAVQTTKPSPGTLLKTAVRELIFSGAWSVGTIDPSFNYGFGVLTNTVSDFTEYTFYGTGFEAIATWSSSTPNIIIRIDGVLYTGAALVNIGSTWTPGTSTWVFGGGPRISISGLTLSNHTVRFTFNGGGTNPFFFSFATITPIHSQESNLPESLQNALSVGSQAIGDNRKLSGLVVKALTNWSQAIGLTTPITSTATIYVPMTDMICVIKTTGNPIDISSSATLRHSASAVSVYTRIYVDGLPVGLESAFSSPGANFLETATLRILVPVSPGTHTVQLYWRTDSGTIFCDSNRRTLTVREV